jgi:hypothetical protein
VKKAVYEKEIFEAFIGTPEKYDWYRKAFDYFESRDGKMSWYWNNWAFLGGFWYFLYRKQMKMALIVLFVVLVLGAVIPMQMLAPLVLVLGVLIGGFGTYFIYKLYLEKREEIEAILPEDEKRIIVMQTQVGGINRWAVPMAIFTVVSLVLIIVGLITMAERSTV